MSHIYALFIFNPITLTQAQRDKINIAMQDLGPNNDLNPANDVHWRWRNDGQAMIVEADFEPTNPTRQQVINAIANRTGFTTTQVNSNLTIFALAGTDRESLRQSVIAYLQSNAAAWGEG